MVGVLGVDEPLGMVNCCPTKMRSGLVMPLARWSASTVVPKRWAMPVSVSPARTV